MKQQVFNPYLPSWEYIPDAKKQLYKNVKSINHSWKRVEQSTKLCQKKQMKMALL